VNGDVAVVDCEVEALIARVAALLGSGRGDLLRDLIRDAG
jgi:hypothetical protein